MFDNVTLKICNLPQNYTLYGKIEKPYQSDQHTYKGIIKNMGIYHSPNCLIIHGSLAKYLNGENITPLNMKKVRQAIEKLEQDITLNLKRATVSSVEFGTSIVMKEKPFEYLNLFGNTKRLTRVEYSKWTGVETVNYTSRTGSFEFIGYDKVKEMLDKEQKIPPLFVKSNVLRLEYKIRKRKGIKHIFKRDLRAYDLFDESIYKRFKLLFFEKYRSIEKMGRLVYTDRSSKITPASLEKLQAEQYRQSFPKDSRYFLQQIVEAGKLSTKSLERIRAGNYKAGQNVYISEQGVLIKELDTLVYERMTFGN